MGGAALRTPYRQNLSEDEKAAGLSRIWSEAKFNFVNFDLVPDLDWDAQYVAFLPRVRQTKSTREFYNVLEEFLARLKDSHTNLTYPKELHEAVYARPLLRTRQHRPAYRAWNRLHDAYFCGARNSQEGRGVRGLWIYSGEKLRRQTLRPISNAKYNDNSA